MNKLGKKLKKECNSREASIQTVKAGLDRCLFPLLPRISHIEMIKNTGCYGNIADKKNSRGGINGYGSIIINDEYQAKLMQNVS